MSRAAALAFVFGVVVMLAFDATLTRILGVALLMGGIGMGAFAIATPEFTQDPDSD